MSTTDIRIPVYSGEFLFNVRAETQIETDEPDLRIIDASWTPEIDSNKIGLSFDSLANREVLRLMKYKTCAFCRQKMAEIRTVGDHGTVLYCKNCFYWGGRGARTFGPADARGIIGRINFVSNPDEAKIDAVIAHLNSNIERLFGLLPKQAEKIMPAVLSDFLKCEVKAIGGTRDHGIDALAIRSDESKMLVQIKWRNKKENKAEGVAVVREVGGTLLARQIPTGLIISTRSRFSKDAANEARLISQNEVTSMGQLNLELRDFNDLIDMFEISAQIRRDNMTIDDIIPEYNDGFNLFGPH